MLDELKCIIKINFTCCPLLLKGKQRTIKVAPSPVLLLPSHPRAQQSLFFPSLLLSLHLLALTSLLSPPLTPEQLCCLSESPGTRSSMNVSFSKLGKVFVLKRPIFQLPPNQKPNQALGTKKGKIQRTFSLPDFFLITVNISH